MYNFGGGRELPKAQGVGGKKRSQSKVRSDAGEGGKNVANTGKETEEKP